MNKLKTALICAAGAALALSPAQAAAQPAAKPINMGLKLEHVTEGGREGGKITAMLPGRIGAVLGFKIGDILIEAGGRPITPAVLREYMKDKTGGDPLMFKVKRGDEVVELKGNAVAAP